MQYVKVKVVGWWSKKYAYNAHVITWALVYGGIVIFNFEEKCRQSEVVTYEGVVKQG